MVKNNNGLILDIEGVLNNYTTDRYGPYSNEEISTFKRMLKNSKMELNETIWDYTFELELANLQALRIMIKKYNIKRIVICSHCRHVLSLTHIRMLFIAKGYPDIANLFIGTTDVCSKEDLDKFKSTKKIKAIEIANYIAGWIQEFYTGNWYVLDDDITEDDIRNIDCCKNIKSLYFEFKATTQEYKRREEMLLNGLAFDKPIDIHPLEKENEEDDELLKDLKTKYIKLKSLILDNNISIDEMIREAVSLVQRMDTTRIIYAMSGAKNGTKK